MTETSNTNAHARELISISDPSYLFELISDIKEMVIYGDLNAGNGNALISKIENAIKSIMNGNTNALTGQLGSFINSADALMNSGNLAEELGLDLIETVEEAILLSDGFFLDPINGDEYPIVKIGEQIWMAENLKATKLNDGTDIPMVTSGTAWLSLTTPGYCWYNNDPSNGEIYGPLYNFNTVDTKKLCPIGWHVPTNGDWTILSNYLGGDLVAGGKLKDIGTIEDLTGLWLPKEQR